MIKATTGGDPQSIQRCLSGSELLACQKVIAQLPVAEPILRYAVSLASRSRPNHPEAPPFIREYVSWGASLRASHYLVLGAKARAALAGRPHVALEDVRAVALPVLRHRIVTNFHAESQGVKPDTIVQRLLETVPPPKSGL